MLHIILCRPLLTKELHAEFKLLTMYNQGINYGFIVLKGHYGTSGSEIPFLP